MTRGSGTGEQSLQSFEVPCVAQGGNTPGCTRAHLGCQELTTAHPCRNGRAQTNRGFGGMSGVRATGHEEQVVGLAVQVVQGGPGKQEQRRAGPE